MRPDFHRDPAFFRHRGRCASTLTRVGRRLIIASLVEEEKRRKEREREKKKEESFRTSRVYSSHGGSRQFAAVSLSQADNGSLSAALCSPVERTRYARIRIRGRIQTDYSKVFFLFLFVPLSLSLSLEHVTLHARACAQTFASRCCARQGPLLLRILGRGILSQRCDETRTRAINHRWPRI